MFELITLVSVCAAGLAPSPPQFPAAETYDQAARHGDIAFFREGGLPTELLQEEWPSNPRWSGERPMVVAARHGHWELVEWLLDNGASGVHWDTAGYMPLDYAIRDRNAAMIQRLASAPMRWRLCFSIAPELWDAIYESVHRNDQELLEALLMVDIQPAPEIEMPRNPYPGIARFEAERDQLASMHLSVASRYAMQRGHAELAALLEAVLDAEEAPLGRARRVEMTDEEQDVHFMMIAARLKTADFLDEHFAEVPADARDMTGQTALIHAARTGNTAACCWLIERGADPSIFDKDSSLAFHYSVQPSPLHYAVELGHEAVVTVLLEAGAEVNLPPIRYIHHGPFITLLDRAAMLGNQSIMALLLNGGAELNLTAPRRHITYTLEVAAGTENAEQVLPMLLAHSRLRDDHIDSIEAALPTARTTTVVDLLLQEDGIEIWTHGSKALYGAALRGQADLVEHLLARGVDPNAKRSSSASPLHAAASTSSVETVDLLLKAGANPNVLDGNHRTPLARALEMADVLELRLSPARRAIIILLLEAGADPDVPLDRQTQISIVDAYNNRVERSGYWVYREIADLLRSYQRPK